MKKSIFFVQGFGYSGSSAVAEFISTVNGNPKAYISESILLKAFLNLSYATFRGQNISRRRKKRLISIILAEENYNIGDEEWRNAGALLTKANICKDDYLYNARNVISIFEQCSKISDSAQRQKLVVEATTNFFEYISDEIHKQLGVVVYDNLINPHLNVWFQVLDLSRFSSVHIYSVYRNTLKDQFYEQVVNSELHSADILTDIKYILIYIYYKVRAFIDRNDVTRESGVGLIPIGSFRFINRRTIKIYWFIFLKDLKRRFDLHLFGHKYFDGERSVNFRMFSFEEFVKDDDKMRKIVFSDYRNVVAHDILKEQMMMFDYKKSQSNVNCYKHWKLSAFVEDLSPITFKSMFGKIEGKFEKK